MRVCDRCGSDAVARKYLEKIQGSELDLCAPCDELLYRFLSEPRNTNTPPLGEPSLAEDSTGQEKTRDPRRHKRPA